MKKSCFFPIIFLKKKGFPLWTKIGDDLTYLVDIDWRWLSTTGGDFPYPVHIWLNDLQQLHGWQPTNPGNPLAHLFLLYQFFSFSLLIYQSCFPFLGKVFFWSLMLMKANDLFWNSVGNRSGAKWKKIQDFVQIENADIWKRYWVKNNKFVSVLKRLILTLVGIGSHHWFYSWRLNCERRFLLR